MNKNSLNLFGSLLVAVFLASCGGESSNLPDPVRPVVSSCTGDTCIKGIFVADGVVEGLNYECGNVHGKTTFQGEFSCPLDKTSSKITFLITHPDTGNKVTLGEYSFRPVYTVTTVNGQQTSSYQAVPSLVPDKRVYLSPRDLTREEFSNTFSDRALSITALLRSLDTDYSAVATLSPASIINLSEGNKLTFLKGLPATIVGDARLVSSTDPEFRNLVNPGLEAIDVSRKIPATGADMSAYEPMLQQASYSLAAGVYHANEPTYLYTGAGVFAPGFKILDDSTDTNLEGVFGRLPFAGRTSLNTNTFFGYMSFGVDRAGRLFGFGASEMRLNSVLLADPVALIPAANQKWPNSGDLKDLTLNLMDGGMQPRSETLVMTQGLVDQGSMAASSGMYMDYFGAETSLDMRLGRWQLKSGSTVLMGAGDQLVPRMELRHSFNAFPILDPDVWNGIASFPLHYKATISEGCGTSSCAKVEINFSVLADGNIISDRNKNCAAVDPVTLREADNTQELPIGVITRAFINNGSGATGGKYLVPLILLPPELVSATETRQIEIGTSIPARLRIDNNSFGIYSNDSETVDGGLTWSDVYMFNKTFVTGSSTIDPKWAGVIVTAKADCAP